MLPLSRFILRRRFWRLAAMTIPLSCGDDPIVFLVFYFLCYLFAFHGINSVYMYSLSVAHQPVTV